MEAYVIACLVLGEWERALAVIGEEGRAAEYAPHLAMTAARLLRAGDARSSLRVAEAAVEQGPGLAASHHALGQALLAKREECAAEAAFLRAIELGPRQLAARIALADLYLSQARPDDARPLVETAVCEAPWDRSARGALSRLWQSARKRAGMTAPETRKLRSLALSARQAERASTPPSLSLCLIVRDEAENLPRVLASVRGLVTEMIVVDTGSTDDTITIARRLGARVEQFPWVDDFAAARNRSLEYASGDWVLVMDADDEFPREGVAAVRRWLRHPAAVSVVGLYRRYPYPGVDRDSVSVHPWLFRNGEGLRFDGAIHEVLVRADGSPARPEITLPVTLHHHGIDGPEEAAHRSRRNLSLLRAAIARDPGDFRLQFYLGISLLEAEVWEEASHHLAEAVCAMGSEIDLSPKARACLGYTLLRHGRAGEAEAVLREGLALHPRYPDLWYALGLLQESQGHLEEAVAAHEQALVGRFGPAMAWHDWTVREAKPHMALCDLKLALGETRSARAHVDAAEAYTGPRAAYEQIRAVIGEAESRAAEIRSREEAEIARLSIAHGAGDSLAGIRLVEALLGRGEVETAHRVLDAWTSGDEANHTAVRIAEGRVLLAAGEPSQALACFCVDRDSVLSVEASLGEAEAYRLLRRPAQAERALQNALAAAPDDPRARLALAELHLSEQEWEKAALGFQQLLDRAHDRWPAWLGLGKAMLHLGQLPAAMECYQLAANLSGGHADVRIALGEARKHLTR